MSLSVVITTVERRCIVSWRGKSIWGIGAAIVVLERVMGYRDKSKSIGVIRQVCPFNTFTWIVRKVERSILLCVQKFR